MWDADAFRAAVGSAAAGGPGAATAASAASALTRDGLHTVVLVEGVSDLGAVEALAARYGQDLAAEGVCVVPIGGAMGVSRFLRVFGRDELAIGVRGLCDEAEQGYFRRGLEQAGYGDGCYVCVADLEDELIRAMGVAGVEQVLAAENDLARFRTFQNQPAQRGRAVERQLHRFLGTTSGRKEHYARALVTALDLDRIPRPLDQLLAGL